MNTNTDNQHVRPSEFMEAGGSNSCLVEDAWRLKEKLTRGTHMSASGDRDAAGVFWSIRKIYTRTST